MLIDAQRLGQRINRLIDREIRVKSVCNEWRGIGAIIKMRDASIKTPKLINGRKQK